MAKLTLNAIGSRYGSIDALNDNFDAIEQALENTLSRDGTSPNALEADLDMNSNAILNASEVDTTTLRINGVLVEPGTSVTAGAAFQTYSYTATAGQTSFSVSPATPYNASIVVIVNGLQLSPNEVNVSGTNVTTPALTLGDEVVIRRYTAEPVAAPEASEVNFIQSGIDAVTRTSQDKMRDFVSVKDFGALGNGTDDLLKLNAARDAAAAAGKTLFFPEGIYGISDRFMFADGGNAFFMPGASLKLLATSVSGAAVSGPYPTQTKPIEVHNLTIDCNNIAGENGVGFGHIIGAKLVNLTVRNCLHSTSTFGGKALQFEGTPAHNVQVLGFNAENCTVGIDIGAHTPASVGQTVHISISNVSMKNVDIPVYVNDTFTLTSPDSYDAVEIFIDGMSCRNCGKLTYAGATEVDGAIFVSDRGYKLTARNVQVVNDRGTYGSTAYGGIGGLTRGSFKGLILEDVLFDADCTALFDFNTSTFQSASTGQNGMYVLANNVRHYGNLDYVVKSPVGASRIGPCRLENIEIGSTAATLAGLLDIPTQSYTNAVLEIVDRDNVFQSTGLRSFNRLAAMGNLPTSLGILGKKAPSISNGTWTPIDSSGASLSFTGVTGEWFRFGEVVIAYGTATYPVTANAAAAKLGGLPFTIDNTGQNRATGILTISTKANAQKLYPEQNTTTAPILTGTAAGATNTDCSAGIFAFMFIYKAKL